MGLNSASCMGKTYGSAQTNKQKRQETHGVEDEKDLYNESKIKLKLKILILSVLFFPPRATGVLIFFH